MKIAIMQPYFLPYIGYWQLIAAVDQFIILDDVNYINRGWINRNQIVVNNSLAWLTLPLKKASQNKLICEIEILDDNGWRHQMEKTIISSYAKSLEFPIVYDLMTNLIYEAQGNLSYYLSDTISRICKVLKINTQIVKTSREFPKGELRGQDRILDICKKLGAEVYLNLPGGRVLYKKEKFEEEGIQLRFLEVASKIKLSSGLGHHKQISIIDTLMHNSSEDIRSIIENFQTIK